MYLAIDGLVTVVQIALFALLLWGAWLCIDELRWGPVRPAKESPAMAEQAGFERVASLVLLALLCTTLAGLA